MNTLSKYFFELWRTAADWSRIDRAQTSTRDAALIASYNDVLHADDEQKIVETLRSRVRATPTSGLAEISAALTCMCCIDEMFSRIHPRYLSQAGSTRVARTSWLTNYEHTRLKTGYFARDERNYLLPRGPLLRNNRSEHASSAEDLADRFSALSVVSHRFDKDGHQVDVEVSLVSSDAIHGVPLGKRTGNERIACVAIAEVSTDIVTTSRLCGDNGFIRYQASEHLKPANRMLSALQQAGSLDIALAPELVMPPSEVERLSDMLRTSSHYDCRLIVAGSGNSDAGASKPPWNESQILNSSGFPLWKQRKLWPASIPAEKAEKLQLCINPTAAAYFEDNSDSKTLHIVDVDGLGRCLVLICQDLKETCISEVLRQYQPDWVFVPILDTGISPGRWHQKTIFPLSEVSQARFVVSSCMSLALRDDPSAQPNLGMFHGPFMPEGGGLDRCVAFEQSQATDTPHFVVIDWGSHSWKQSSLGVASPPPAPPASVS